MNPQTVHLINPMRNASGGSEWRTIQIFELLAEHTDVTIWTPEVPDTSLLGRVPIRRLEPRAGVFPRSGNLIFIGTYFQVQNWIHQAKPNRIVFIHNLHSDYALQSALAATTAPDLPKPEVAYASADLRRHANGPEGEVHPSPLDFERFRPEPRPYRPFTVGRVSRDVLLKHHPDDPAMYRRLADAGVSVRILGGTLFAEELAGLENVELLPENSMPVEEFLRSLDCFYYRTHPDWYETWGRVVLEAMACGVPVVAEGRHGYCDYLTPAQSFVTEDEGFDKIMALRDPAVWNQRSEESLNQARSTLSPEVISHLIDYYTREKR